MKNVFVVLMLCFCFSGFSQIDMSLASSEVTAEDMIYSFSQEYYFDEVIVFQVDGFDGLSEYNYDGWPLIYVTAQGNLLFFESPDPSRVKIVYSEITSEVEEKINNIRNFLE